MKRIEVVAAVFKRDESFLVCRRKTDLSNAGEWEFPGGKRNTSESLEAALVRELAEELNVVVSAEHLEERALGSSSHHTKSKIIELHCFVVTEWRGEFKPTDHDRIEWRTVDELHNSKLSDADVPFVDRIETYLNSQ